MVYVLKGFITYCLAFAGLSGGLALGFWLFGMGPGGEGGNIQAAGGGALFLAVTLLAFVGLAIYFK